MISENLRVLAIDGRLCAFMSWLCRRNSFDSRVPENEFAIVPALSMDEPALGYSVERGEILSAIRFPKAMPERSTN